jgi:general bacterial porin, GBP family
MHKKAIAAAAALMALAISTQAHSESSVTLFGVIDSGFLYKTNADAAGNRQYQIVSGGEWTNFWGIQGSEDLGGGYQATFRLENGFRSVNGTMLTSNTLFDRGAVVGLKSDRYGWIRFGRNWTPFHDVLAKEDIGGFTNFMSMNNQVQNATGFAGGNYYWANNSVRYDTPDLHGFSASALYSLGGKAGDFTNQRVMSAAAQYNYGPLLFNAVYIEGKDPTGNTDLTVARAYGGGIVYRFGSLGGASLAYTAYRDPATGVHQDFYSAATKLFLAPDFSLTPEYILRTDNRGSDYRSNGVKLSANYLLSKRTFLYADVGYVWNKSKANFGIVNNVAGVTGLNQMGATVGIRSSF